MCLLVVKKFGVASPSINTLRIGFENNPDGAGVGWTDGTGYVRFRKFLTWDGFKKFLNEAEFSGREKSFSIMYHFRMATHGTVRLQNVHPFVVSESLSDIMRTEGKAPMIMAHNGIIGGLHSKEDISDTMIFNKDILANPNVRKHLVDPAIQKLLSNFLIGSKVAVLDGRGKFVILNETYGHYKDGVWFSNYGYVRYSLPATTNYNPTGKYTNYKNNYSPYFNLNKVETATYCDYCDEKRPVKLEGGMNLCSECREDMYYAKMVV